MRKALCVLLLAVPVAGAALAKDLSDPEFRAEVAAGLAGVEAEDIQPSPVPGIYRVTRGETIGYLTADGRYLFDGDLIEMQTRRNLSELARRRWRRDALAGVSEQDMVIFAPEAPEHTVTVFTDVDCPYCRRLHARIDEFLAAGIRVRYLFYPLDGPESESYTKAEAVWCADERQRALTRAKRGERIEMETGCPNPVMAHLELAARTLELRGTPAIITQDGSLLNPSTPVPQIIRRIEQGGAD